MTQYDDIYDDDIDDDLPMLVTATTKVPSGIKPIPSTRERRRYVEAIHRCIMLEYEYRAESCLCIEQGQTDLAAVMVKRLQEIEQEEQYYWHLLRHAPVKLFLLVPITDEQEVARQLNERLYGNILAIES